MTDRHTPWWISLTLSSIGWILLLPLYGDLPPWIGAVFFAAAGLVAIAASQRAIEPIPPTIDRTTAALLVVAAAVAGYYASWGMRAALALFVCGAVGTAFAIAVRSTRRISRGLLAVGTITVAQGAVASLCATLFGHVHAAPILSAFDLLLVRALGRSVSWVGRTIYVATATGPIAVVASWDQLGVMLGLLAWCGFSLLVASEVSASHRLRTLAKGTAVIAAYLLVRRVLLLLIALETGSPGLFWNPAVLSLSMFPLIVLLARFSGLRPSRIGTSLQSALCASRRMAVLVASCAFVATLFSLSALYLVPAGPHNEGTVLIDEAHGDWESTRIAMDTETYGLTTTYNYASLFDWLSYYYPVGQLTQPIDAQSLAGCSVLVLKTPSSPYSQEEIEAIDAFVRRGGGLFVIGDHTNVFGTTTVLNPVLARFGLALNYDSTYRLDSGSFTTYAPARPCFDPIMQHVAQFDFLTSCSIRAPLVAYRTIADDRILSNQADYATRDFFPKHRYSLSSEFGRFIQTAAVLHGGGRVVLFTDSTCFSNFSVFMDGYPSFLLGTFAFLSRGNGSVPWRPLFLAAAVLATAVLGALMWRARRVQGLAAVVCGILLGWAVFSVAACFVHRLTYPLPEPAEGVPFVYFDVQYSDIEIAPQPASAEAYDRTREFDTFFVWSQRVGKIPQRVSGERRDEVLDGRPYIIINPHSEMDSEFLVWIDDYVTSGGTMFLLDGCGRDTRGSDQLLARFELSPVGACGSDRVIEGAAITAREISPSLTLYVSVVSVGDGHVVLISDSSPFSNLSLGGAFTAPSPIQEALYDTVFWLLREAIQ
ncbi:DUF4350 domain-containing protein [Candidatus Bipolaricaulota bacterium]